MINIPLVLISAIVALLLTDGVFSIATLVGFISLVGITSRKVIIMIAYYLHLIREEDEDFDEEMVIRGSLEIGNRRHLNMKCKLSDKIILKNFLPQMNTD